VTREDTEALEW